MEDDFHRIRPRAFVGRGQLAKGLEDQPSPTTDAAKMIDHLNITLVVLLGHTETDHSRASNHDGTPLSPSKKPDGTILNGCKSISICLSAGEISGASETLPTPFKQRTHCNLCL